MAVIDIKINPSRRDLRVFSLLFAAFMAMLGALCLGRPHALLGAAAVTAAAFLISIVFNNDQPRRMQLLGLIIPIAFVLIGGLEKVGAPAIGVAIVTWSVGLIGALIAWCSPAGGKTLYTGWMYAALPMGWTISHVILGIVFYLVLTPIGLVLRLLGRDAMTRQLDRSATTYWIEHNPSGSASGGVSGEASGGDKTRYFHQF